MKTIRKWWKPGIAFLLALLALQLGASLLVRTKRARAFLTRQVELSFGRSVEVRQYSASLFPSPQIDAYGISVAEDPVFGHEYFLRADRLSAGLRWAGLFRGRFELGTLRLDRPSLIFARNDSGRWNLEHWLPASSAWAAEARSEPHSTPAYRLQRIEISDGRVNFKLLDDKGSFAFTQVQGSVEQTASGRWQMDLRAEPWRSGVPLQLAGTVRLHGDVAGTSARLQPANFRVTWEKSSLADVFRLLGGQDFGVRGLFAAEATLQSAPAAKNAQPGDWSFTLEGRALSIHRWDLTERVDNPRLALRVAGRWNPGLATLATDEMVLESRRSRLEGAASLAGNAPSGLELKIVSLGVQAADLLDWYRAFRPGVAEEITAKQFFTGNATFRGWPLTLQEGAVSSTGGRWTVPGFSSPVEVRAIRGGAQKKKLVVPPFTVLLPARRDDGALLASSNADPPESEVSVSLQSDFATRSGGLRLQTEAVRLPEIFALAGSFGRPLENGWELRGKAAGDLYWDWQPGESPSWSGRADLAHATLQLAGLNLPVQIESLRGEWRSTQRRFSFAQVAAFGAQWSGWFEQPNIQAGEFGEAEPVPWTIKLQADHLDAAELDRWVGPRARPNWLRRLLPSGLGGTVPDAPGVVLKGIRAGGELAVEDLTIEKIRLKDFRAQTKLDHLKLTLSAVQAKWSGGEVKGSLQAAVGNKPSYEIAAAFERVALAQTPWLLRASDRLSGTAWGKLELHAAGIGRDSLLASLTGKGELRLANVELRGWDIPGTMAVGEWQPGNSRWISGAGTFHLGDRGFDLNALRLVSASGDFLLKGSVSFAEDTELTAESHASGRKPRAENNVRFLQISGPLTEPKVSLQRAAAQQPGD